MGAAGCLLAALGMLVEARGLGALEPTTPLGEYGRQSWAMENGLPQNTIHSLVQTHDGFVWLGTEAGLVRFDGNSFAVFDTTSKPALPNGDIRCLLETRDGALWIGTGEGLARWKDGVVTTFTTRNGLPDESIRALVQTADGTLWAWSDGGLARLNGEGFAATNAGSIPAAAITTVLPDGQGGMRVESATAEADYGSGRWTDFADKSASGAPRDGVVFIQLLRGGVRATASMNLLQMERDNRVVERLTAGQELPGTRIQALYADREGCLWIGTNGGLARLVDGKVQLLPVTDPLAGASILSILEDREGNLWIGTETGGLHILRDARFRNIGTHEGLSSDGITSVVEDAAGTLWVGTSGNGLNAMRREPDGKFGTKIYTVRDGLLSDVILSLAAGRNGELWVGTPDGLNLIHGGRVESFTSGDGLPDDFVRSLLADADGSLWVGTRRGLTHWMSPPASGHMVTYTQAAGLGNDLVGAMARDSAGSLWVATLAGLSRIEGGRITNYTTANGLSSNVVTALLPRPGGSLVIGTQDHGWNFWDGKQFSTTGAKELSSTTVHAIVDDERDHLWFATANGIARCDCTMTAECTHWIEFGPADGLRSRETATNSHPSAWRSRDGNLWFATPKGLVEVDPARFPVNAVPPPVVLERFAVDDVDQPESSTPEKVAAGHNHFQFDYAGLSFVAPQKVRYRYMLDGFDHAWTEAGNRRVAYYTSIPPGTYTFRVQAANNDGLWNTEGAAVEFEIEPHFYQTLWFYILLVLTVGALVALVLKRRLLLAEREFSAVLKERNRIAREIHDTLAQGYVGISVQLEVLAELLRHNKVEAAAKQLDATRGHVREGLAEARQSIWALRSQDSGEKTLPVSIRRATEQAGGHGLEANFSVHGAYRPMPPGTEREILRIAQEAIHNVKKHAGAKQMAVQLDYGPAEIALEVRDDGCGFTTSDGAEPPAGHYGITGMRERTATIGGALEVTSQPGAGTTVRLHVPSPKEAQ